MPITIAADNLGSQSIGIGNMLYRPGDLVIICTFGSYNEAEMKTYEPTVVLVDKKNRVVNPTYEETPGPLKAIKS